jgi:hypothetical protein
VELPKERRLVDSVDLGVLDRAAAIAASRALRSEFIGERAYAHDDETMTYARER